MIYRLPVIKSLLTFFMRIYLWYFITFRRDKLKVALMKRTEIDLDCKDCGLCCAEQACVAYDKKTKLCRIWKYADYNCKMYPLFEWQIKNRSFYKKCKYRWLK